MLVSVWYNYFNGRDSFMFSLSSAAAVHHGSHIEHLGVF